MNTEEMAVKLAEVDQRSKSNTHRIDEIKESVDGLTQKVETIEQKPAKRWDGMVDKIIFGLIGALVTAVAAGLLTMGG